MRIRHLSIALAAVALLLTTAVNTSAQQLFLSVDAGLSRPTGSEFDNYDYGYSLGGNLLFYITDNFRLGGRVAYNRWGPDEAAFLDRVDPLGIVDSANVTGDASIVEILPLARLLTNYPLSPVNFFVQGGAGLYILNMETTVSGNDTNNVAVEEVFGKNNQYKFGAQLGAGLLLGSPDFLTIELYPAFNLIFNNEGDTFQYFTVNLGIGLGI